MKRYITTPIYYVNDRPHIGHAYTTILADAIARWSRLAGTETFFLTGTDEHGQKVQQAAEKRGLTPTAHVDELHLAFKNLWPQLEVTNDRFIRTTEPAHIAVVQGALSKLWDEGQIYEKEYGGWYSVSEERYWTEKDLVDGKCPQSGNPVQWIDEKNYFFRMGDYQQALLDHIEANPDFIQPSFRRNEVLGFLRQPLEDLCISRPKTRLEWGIELPFDSDYVTYVWFDALLNYLTGIGFPDSDSWRGWWEGSLHLLGKDILTTHCVYWTTMLLAMKVPLPKRLVAHGWWLMDNSKMSKTKGNVVDPMALKDQYGLEVFRYYLLREMSVGQDANFSEVGLVTRNNTELANDLGNLVNRTLNMVEKRFDGRVPAYVSPDPADDDVRALIDGLAAQVTELTEKFAVHKAIDACMAVVRRLNKYLTDTAPYKVVKTDPERAGSILHLVLVGLREAAWWLQAAMPKTMVELIRRIGGDSGSVTVGAAIDKGDPLFPKYDMPVLDSPEEAEEKAAEEAAEKDAKKRAKDATPGIIEFTDFLKVQLRVAVVKTAERVADADKLLRLEVDDGGEELRQVVAGIAEHYAPETLIGRRVTLVANLKPRKIFGLESRGMLLAARAGDRLFLVAADGDAPAGSEVS
ncbi:MAG: methionyl-tRNA synthetase [Myxococcota bacterium]|jgi:methionyl-tRNA synthetase